MMRDSDAKSTNDKASPPKRLARGFAHTGGMLSNQMRKAAEKRGFAQTKLLTQWPEIVGQTIADIARPIKISFSREGIGATLTILASGARAPELQMMLPELKEKVNACYGYNAISRIRITQTAETGFAETGSAFDHKKPAKQLSPERIDALQSHVAAIGDNGLRAALEKLGKNVLTR